jgi:hypothetical protein
MDDGRLHGRDDLALELARRELELLAEALDRLRTLLDGLAEPAPEPRARFRRDGPADRSAAARSIAAQMALAGAPREVARGRVTGVVPEDEVDQILDLAYAVTRPDAA